MTYPDDTYDIVVDRLPGVTVHRRTDIPIDRVLDAVESPGEVLKTSSRSETRRVDDWVVKSSRRDAFLGTLKHTVLRARYRTGWAAALHLARRSVHVPRPCAFIERGRYGLITGNTVITEYLEECMDVEHFADAMRERWTADDVHEYLAELAEAVNGLSACGAYHSDLAGKNILTRDGATFYFIDLDGIVLHRHLTETMRMKTHVQLYDSFCDRWADAFLEPFIARMLPNQDVLPEWMRTVRRLQAKRRARTEAVWRKQGRL